ncbi:hypothetical protein PLEOSDRAFT_1110151 [Pleurotus ostreatus PC15]|uniref:Uncharacterized protein n=1 Tax=Pleurotus ostreatus (strain PC15) TaxID=1137138 RepID=A0A067N2F8_PLEO1|nr:hypothetical protein PLEOSDRAFT_1110151 [Pleurotus ostreatus PC15]
MRKWPPQQGEGHKAARGGGGRGAGILGGAIGGGPAAVAPMSMGMMNGVGPLSQSPTNLGSWPTPLLPPTLRNMHSNVCRSAGIATTAIVLLDPKPIAAPTVPPPTSRRVAPSARSTLPVNGAPSTAATLRPDAHRPCVTGSSVTKGSPAPSPARAIATAESHCVPSLGNWVG